MKKTHFKLCLNLGLFAALAALSAQADKFHWNNSSGGYWDDAANWTSDSGTGTYPGDAANDPIGENSVSLPFTITLRKDARTSNWTFLYPSGTGFETIDLNGHFLNCGYLQFMGSAAPSNYNVIPNRAVEFRNGSAYLGTSINIGGAWSTANPGTLVCTDCIVTGNIESVGKNAALIVRDGAKFVFTTWGRTEVNFPSEAISTSKAFFSITGANSRVEMKKTNLKLQNVKTGFFLFEGTSALLKELKIGPTAASSGNFTDVRGATLEVTGGITLGADNATSTGSKFLVSGEAAKVTASTLTIYDGEACVLGITVPTTGFDQESGVDVAPVQFGGVTIVPRTDGYDNLGDTEFQVSCFAWMNANPLTTIPLLTLETADASALTALKNAVTWPDVPSALIEAGKGPVLSLSADNRTLLLTAPEINYKPAFSVSTLAGDAVGAKKFVVALSDYGAGSTSLTSISLEWADDPEFTGSTVRELISTPVSTAAPCELVYPVNGGFVEWKTYYARITLTNDGEYEETVGTTFVGDGIAETLKWIASGTDGVWQDGSKWTTNGVVANQYPHAEDTAQLGYADSVTTVTLQDDVTIRRFYPGSGMYPDIGGGGGWTLDLGGHALEATCFDDVTLALGGGSASAMNLSIVSPYVNFRNGAFTTPSMSGGNSGIQLGSVANTGSGSLIFDNVTANTRLQQWCNSSRIFVRNGAAFISSGDITYQSHTALQYYPALCVTGANSRVEATGKSITVRGKGAAFYALDGASVSCGNFYVGRKTTAESGDLSSDLTLVKLDNGTLTVSAGLKIGWSEKTTATEDQKLSAKLQIGGTNSTVTVGGALTIYENLGTVFEFALPPAGYKATPLSAGSLAFVAREEGLTDYGATKVALTGTRAWARNHPNETQELIRLTAANPEGLASLKANATFDSNRLNASALAVSADGTALTLTAPSKPGVALIIR